MPPIETPTGSAPAPAAERSYEPPAEEREAASPRNDSASEPKGGEPDKSGAPAPVVTKGGLKVNIPKPRSRFQERISQLTGARDRYEGEAQSLRERLARYEGSDGQPIQRGQDAKAPGQRGDGLSDPNAALQPESFETYGDYIQALVMQTMRMQNESNSSARGKAAVREYHETQIKKFNEHAAPLIAEHGEAFMEAISDDNLPISEAMADAVLELDELGPYVMLYLAANPQEAGKMARLNPRAATVAIGRLAAKLDNAIKGGEGQPSDSAPTSSESNGASAEAPATPSRPTPTAVPTPRGGSPSSLDSQPNDKDDLNTWMRKETDRLRRKNPNARFYGAR